LFEKILPCTLKFLGQDQDFSQSMFTEKSPDLYGHLARVSFFFDEQWCIERGDPLKGTRAGACAQGTWHINLERIFFGLQFSIFERGHVLITNSVYRPLPRCRPSSPRLISGR
jgi:hypothetical protein